MADSGRAVRVMSYGRSGEATQPCSVGLDVSWEILVGGRPAMGALSGDVHREIWRDHASFCQSTLDLGCLQDFRAFAIRVVCLVGFDASVLDPYWPLARGF